MINIKEVIRSTGFFVVDDKQLCTAIKNNEDILSNMGTISVWSPCTVYFC